MYIMTAPIEADYVFSYQVVGAFPTFREFLEAYPPMKQFYGDDLHCAYVSKKDYIDNDEEDWCL